ncbi:D-glycero-beta-D-manno-heptose 1-phosphate adenylyltransferase [Ginsengibacter hankyongi]|uniref:D-glycero-beta-D-manno-heptose 1-phosphate adenylyltransferase n=1 Tax=Ginsengibacter hankyongi TaxID=2607284 RepID=A0A5J5IB02_9BACT|nr:D-glycero-beta-D-manno-heptose 1-phosphate adenylyltransferase [Ginsengibacter hankyongi]KAA9034668.1 D-glycero-beta-D-manno-heptose 1-phosphate adenylyltransferase [Ginsengibacter hankyongi]
MKQSNKISERIFSAEHLQSQIKWWRLINKTIAFTNGVFDILHEGHIKILSQAASFADVLIIGVNSDASVKRLKGNERPVNNQQSRSLILASLIMTDAVIVFDEDTPYNLIKSIMPDVLVKGGDYTHQTVVGADEVMANGGRVEIIPLEEGFSTTGIIAKIKSL